MAHAQDSPSAADVARESMARAQAVKARNDERVRQQDQQLQIELDRARPLESTSAGSVRAEVAQDATREGGDRTPPSFLSRIYPQPKKNRELSLPAFGITPRPKFAGEPLQSPEFDVRV